MNSDDLSLMVGFWQGKEALSQKKLGEVYVRLADARDVLDHLFTVINGETDEGHGVEWSASLRCAMTRAKRVLEPKGEK